MKIPDWKPLYEHVKNLAAEHRRKIPYLAAFIAVLALYGVSHYRESRVTLYRNEGAPDFKDARILSSANESYFENKERHFSKQLRELVTSQASLRASNEDLRNKIAEMQKDGLPRAETPPAVQPTAVAPSASGPNGQVPTQDPIRVGPSEALSIGSIDYQPGLKSGHRSAGPAIISFPVKEAPQSTTEGIVLPAGSYVKAKLMTGVEAPEGKTYPVLLQLDFAYILPNNKKIDLSGCFMIAKSQGDLSTERVQMQATKMSCVSKLGKMFEREVNGFIADDTDNSFAVIGKVNSKQDRVAAMAFLSSIVEGVGKALQVAQTTQQTNAVGGQQTSITGDQAGYIAAGGASNAASMVTQWYLKQAQNLLPTINVGSGQDVWVVMQDTAQLPHEYFKSIPKGDSRESVYTYFSRLAD